MSLLLFLGLNENSFCQWVRSFYLAEPSHWLVFVRSLRNGSSSLGSSPFYLFMGAQPFWCRDFKSTRHFQKLFVFMFFKKYLFLFLVFRNNLDICFPYFCKNFIFQFSSRLQSNSTPQTKSRFFGKKLLKKNGFFLSTNEHPWGVVLFLYQ